MAVKCLLCKPHKDIKLNANKYSSDNGNFTRHITNKHMAKGEAMGKGAKVYEYRQVEYRHVEYRQIRNCPKEENRSDSHQMICGKLTFLDSISSLNLYFNRQLQLQDSSPL